MGTNNDNKDLAAVIVRLTQIIIFLVICIIGLGLLLAKYIPAPKPEVEIKTPVPDQFGNFTSAGKTKALENTTTKNTFWSPPAASEISSDQKELIAYGKELISHTCLYFGEKGKLGFTTNGMNCQNCHLDAGTKVFGNNYSAVAATYPKYRARSGTIENVYKRVNDCFERSLNGEALDTASKEMSAIVSYIYWLGSNVEKGKKPDGSGLKDLVFLDRSADPVKGKDVYTAKCQSCHQENGEGVINSDKTAYTYPPLWGDRSYNDGAGLYRVSNFAKFVKCNMPLGATHELSQLTDEEAWDVAAYVNSQPHPHKDTKKDWPKLNEKPVDHPFGPYADGFSEKEHKYGPFKPIKQKLESLKKGKS